MSLKGTLKFITKRFGLARFTGGNPRQQISLVDDPQKKHPNFGMSFAKENVTHQCHSNFHRVGQAPLRKVLYWRTNMKILVLVTLFFTAVGTALFSGGLSDPIVVPSIILDGRTATETSSEATHTSTTEQPTASVGATATPESEPSKNPDDIFFEAPPQYSEPLDSSSGNNFVPTALMLILMAACLCSL